jgi:hypothetical protein
MDVVEKIRQRLAGNPDVRLIVEANSIRVVPVREDGFEVGLAAYDGGRRTVWFAGWHEEFEGEDEALQCVGFGLSRRCRLKVHSAGGFDYRWTAEYLFDEHWAEDSTTGLLAWPFWKKRTVRYLRNALIPWEETP